MFQQLSVITIEFINSRLFYVAVSFNLGVFNNIKKLNTYDISLRKRNHLGLLFYTFPQYWIYKMSTRFTTVLIQARHFNVRIFVLYFLSAVELFQCVRARTRFFQISAVLCKSRYLRSDLLVYASASTLMCSSRALQNVFTRNVHVFSISFCYRNHLQTLRMYEVPLT